VQDLPAGRSFIGHPFPIVPTFDALSWFSLQWHVDAHANLDASISDVHPLTYDLSNTATDVTVVVTHLYAYSATYADDSSNAPDGVTHIRLEPYPFIVQKAGDGFLFTDLFISNADGLPERVRLAGSHDKSFVIDYQTLNGYWLIRHVHYEETALAPLGTMRAHGIIDADFTAYTFPLNAPPELLTLPPMRLNPTPSPSADPTPPGGPF
jgi:hypothetical protein